MTRCSAVLSILLLAAHLSLAQTLPDSLQPEADTMFVIPAGPVAGTFTDPARLVVVDTVAGWAKIQVEGWVPVSSVLHRMTAPLSGPGQAQPPSVSKAAPSTQCEGRTTKGARCKRKAATGSRFCWQHQK
ncbi:MAG TPA: hypothetical protein VGL38_00250 [bacterium]|jgi:hypothetical protein